MKKTKAVASAFLLLCCLCAAGGGFLVSVRGIAAETKALPSQKAVRQIETAFMGIPYRDDGAVDSEGRYTLFADQKKTFATPGLNCSGFVLAASNKIFATPSSLPISLTNAKKDRKGDSGPGSHYGEDWDFGLDLILNIAQGRNARVILPGGLALDPSLLDGRNLNRIQDINAEGGNGRGFALQNRKAWAEILLRLHPGRLYLWVMSREYTNKPLQYHHVGIILAPEGANSSNIKAGEANSGKILLYHALRKGGVSKIDLGAKGGLDNFLNRYPDKNGSNRHIYLLEMDINPVSSS